MNVLVSQIQVLLGNLVAQSSWDQAADEDRFEGYLFGLILRAAAKEGASISFRNRAGPFQGVATFRTSPGHLWSDANPYTHAVIRFSGLPQLEAHVGVYILGKSKLRHEADVVVLSSAVAEACRNGSVDPPSSEAVFLVEAKYHTSDPGVSLGREFLGLSAECGREKCVFVTNRPALRLQRLFEQHGREWGHQVLPTQQNDVDRLVGLAQRAFARYKAR